MCAPFCVFRSPLQLLLHVSTYFVLTPRRQSLTSGQMRPGSVRRHKVIGMGRALGWFVRKMPLTLSNVGRWETYLLVCECYQMWPLTDGKHSLPSSLQNVVKYDYIKGAPTSSPLPLCNKAGHQKVTVLQFLCLVSPQLNTDMLKCIRGKDRQGTWACCHSAGEANITKYQQAIQFLSNPYS